MTLSINALWENYIKHRVSHFIVKFGLLNVVMLIIAMFSIVLMFVVLLTVVALYVLDNCFLEFNFTI